DGECISYWRVDAKGRIGAAATLSVFDASTKASTTQALRRLRATEPLAAWCLDVRRAAASVGAGFAIAAMEDEAHGATHAAV
ncbi:hypothetical protein, partial [Ideonella azotifigens]